MKQIIENQERNNAEIKSAIQDIKSTQIQSLNEINEIKTKLNEMCENKIDLKNLKNCLEINQNDFQSYFQSDSNFNFKILIIDIDDNIYESLEDAFYNTIAFSDWNIIIDLNPKEKLFKAFQDQLETKKNFVKLIFKKDLQNINEQVKDGEFVLISNQKYKCYLTAFLNDENDDDFVLLQEFIKKLDNFFKKIINGKHSIMSTNLIVKETNEDYYRQIEEINKTARKIINDSNSNEKMELVYLVLNDLQNFTPEVKKILDKNVIDINKKICVMTSAQFISSMRFDTSKEITDLLLPAYNANEIIWSNKDSIQYGAYFEVYHKNIGKKSFENDNEIKKKVIGFIVENEIDPETIFINDELTIDNKHILSSKFRTFIETECMISFNEEKSKDHKSIINSKYMSLNDFVNEIIKASKKNDFFVNNKLVKKIEYSAYCGGTTIGRILLYRIRKHLPCFRLLYLDNGNILVEGIKKISAESNLPVVILIDTDARHENSQLFNYEEVEKFSRELSTYKSIRHFIIFMDRMPELKTNSTRGYYANPILSEKDINEYKKFYEFYLEVCENEFTIREKTLCQVRLLYLKKGDKESSIKLKQIAEEYLRKFCPNQQKLLILMYFFEMYTLNNQCFDSDLIAFILKISNGKIGLRNNLRERITNYTYEILSIIKFKSDNYGCKLLNRELSELIVDLIIQKAKKNKFEYFFEIFKNLCIDILQNDCSNNHIREQIILLADILLLKSKQIDEFEENDSYDSILIEKCKSDDEFGKRRTADTLKSYYEIFKNDRDKNFHSYSKNLHLDISPKIGIAYSRFIFFNNESDSIEKKDESINYIQKVLGINGSLENTSLRSHFKQSHLLCAYGDLMRHYINENLKYSFDNQKKRTPIYLDRYNNEEKIFDLIKDCLKAYEISFNLSSDNYPLPLIGECHARKRLLVYLSNKFNNMKNYTEYLENTSTPEFIRDSERKIEKNIDILDQLKNLEYTGIKYDLNKIYNDCRLTTLKLRYGFKSIKLEDIKTNLKNSNEYFFVNFFRILEIEKASLNINEYIYIIDYYDKCMERFNINSNSVIYIYRDSISSYIRLANLTSTLNNEKYHIDRAIAVSEKWKSNYKDDPDAFFYYGVLKLLKGINYNNNELFGQARDSLNSCRDMYIRNKNCPRKFKTPVYMIGNNTNSLSGLIEFSDQIELSKLKKFEGELFERKSKYYINYHGFYIECLPRNVLNENEENILKAVEINQRKTYQYHIAIRRSGLFAFKYSLKN